MNPPGARRNSESRSSTQRPTSSGSTRPASALARPTSRSSSRVSQRPQSSLTVRPPSSASQRAQSRLSNRPQSRSSRTKILPHCQSLVSQVTGIQDTENEDYQELVEDVVRRLESVTISKPSASVDMGVIDRTISGHALKAKINLHDQLAVGLEGCFSRLKHHLENQGNDLDATFLTNRMPDHLQFLIALSQPPSSATLAYAELYLENARNPLPQAPSLTWAEILAQEPFEGDHWEGVMDPIVVKDDWDTTPSLSPLNSDDLALDDDDDDSSLPSSDDFPRNEQSNLPTLLDKQDLKTQPPFSSHHTQLLEELHSRQYWRKEWQPDVDPGRPFDLSDPSTLGASIDNAATSSTRHMHLSRSTRPIQKFIDEEDMVREVWMALQGRESIVLVWEGGQMQTLSSAPRIAHLSPVAQASILASLAKYATILQHLRMFVAAIFAQSPNRISPCQNFVASEIKIVPTKTAEAFAEAVDSEIRRFEAWGAQREEEMCRARLGMLDEALVVSLLSTEQSIRNEFEDSFEVLLSVVQGVFGYPMSSTDRQTRSPATLATALLDTLFSRLQEYMERRALVTGSVLLRVFISSSEPIWGMIGHWLRNGMSVSNPGDGQHPGELEEEFFIEYSGIGVGTLNMGPMDPDFWKEGYSLRDAPLGWNADEQGARTQRQSVVPKFLAHVADLILGTGKAIGLVRVLGLPPSAHGFKTWPSFAELVDLHAQHNEAGLGDASGLFAVSLDTLAEVIQDYLQGPCEASGAFLAEMFVDDCELWTHVNAVEDLFLMRRGDALTHFLDIIFAKMDLNHSWGDFHFLNTAFSDVVRSTASPGSEHWIQLSLVRLSYRGSRDKDKQVGQTLKAIDGLSVEYAVPYPVTYIFRPEVIQVYSDIFVFLVQLRRAKHVLERILMRGEHSKTRRSKEELKLFYAMRSRLSWFLNTLLNFLTTHALHVQILKFHEALHSAKSLDEIISFHDQHLEKLQQRCMLDTSTPALHKAVMSICDICLHFTNLFTAFAGETTATHDISRQSITLKHRSRKQRRQKRNVVGFAGSLQDLSSDDEDEEQVFDPEAVESPSMDASLSFFDASGPLIDRDFFGWIEKVSREVDGLVRYVRRGVESIAGGTTEAASTFGVLAFALEDWDL